VPGERFCRPPDALEPIQELVESDESDVIP
jgi:hypothetical protein